MCVFLTPWFASIISLKSDELLKVDVVPTTQYHSYALRLLVLVTMQSTCVFLDFKASEFFSESSQNWNATSLF